MLTCDILQFLIDNSNKNGFARSFRTVKRLPGYRSIHRITDIPEIIFYHPLDDERNSYIREL
jgi:hypothetical protein